MIGVNANGIKSKLGSLDFLMSELNPAIICIQETKCKRPGTIKCKNSANYVCFELNRKLSGGGGVATLVKPDLEPVLVFPGSDEEEILVVEVHVEGLHVRVINAYAPQACDNKDKKQNFWARMSAEVKSANEANTAIIIQMDGNCHGVAENDALSCDENGNLFNTFLEQNQNLSLINGTLKCNGKITRRREKAGKVEESDTLVHMLR